MPRFSVSSATGCKLVSGKLNRKRLIILAAAACALSVAASGICSQAVQASADQSLQQNVEAIRQILAKDGLYQRTTTTERKDYNSVMERKFAVTEADGCKLVVVSSVHSRSEMPTQNRVTDRNWNDIYRPDFSVMDPAGVVVEDPAPPQPQWQVKGYLVRISVEVGKPLIVASTVDKATNAARDMPGLPALAVYVSSREAADLLAKKFSAVAAACRPAPAR